MTILPPFGRLSLGHIMVKNSFSYRDALGDHSISFLYSKQRAAEQVGKVDDDLE